MKQLKQSQFIKNGVEHENISSPETSVNVTRVVSISVDKYGKFQYTTDGVNYIELDPQTSEITSVDTIYDDVSELPESQQYGTILPAYTNTALPVILYEYTEDDGWVEKQQVNEYSIYYVTEKGTLYIFIGTEFVSTTPEQSIKIISPSSNVLTTEEYNTLVANNCVLGTTISGLDWAEAGTILTRPFEYNGSLRGMYIRNSKIGTYLITISTKTIGNGATDIVLNQVAQLNGKAIPSYPANSGTFNLQIVDGTIQWNTDNYVTTDTDQTITGVKTFSAQPVVKSIKFVNNTTSPTGSAFEIHNDNGYNAKIRMNGKGLMFTAGAVYPSEASGEDFGSSGYKWKDIYLSGNITDGTNSTAVSDIASKSNVASNYVSVNAQELNSTQQTQARTNIDAQETIDANNMLSADLVDDTSTTHKFATSSELSQIATNTGDIATINGKIPSEASSNNQLADKEFVNSSINNFASYYITKNALGDPFDTKAQLFSASTFYSGGVTRTPTINDYAIVTADEIKGVIVSGYASFTTTADYIDYYVIYNNESVLVTDANKDSLGITAGTTIAYESLPTTRYSYQGGTYPNGQWEYLYSLNNTAFTQAQMNALNSGIDSTKVTQIGTNASNISSLQSNKANDNAVVHLAGSETITGTKTFTQGIDLGDDATITKDSSNRLNLNYGNSAKVKVGSAETIIANRIGADGDNSQDIGRASVRWRDLYLAGQLKDGNNADYGLVLPDTTSYTANKTIATTDQVTSVTITTTSGSESISDGTNTLNFGSNAFTNTAIPTINATSGSESITDGTNTLSFGANAFNSTTIPTASITTTTGSEAVTINGSSLNVVTRDTAQTISGEKTFTGNIKNTGTYYIGSGNVVLASMSGSDLTIGNSSSVLKLVGSGTLPTYNGNSLAKDNDVVHTTGDETITGTKTIGGTNSGVLKLYTGLPTDANHTNRIEEANGYNMLCNGDVFGQGTTIFVGNTNDVLELYGSGTRPQYKGGANNLTDVALMSDLYPVGAIYMSTNSTSPASLFGGTWSEISAGKALWTTATSSGDAGGTISAGLPNIKGTIGTGGTRMFADTSKSGAFNSSETGSYTNWGNGANSSSKIDKLVFNANDYNSIYSDSVTTVQPPAYKVYAWVRTA